MAAGIGGDLQRHQYREVAVPREVHAKDVFARAVERGQQRTQFALAPVGDVSGAHFRRVFRPAVGLGKAQDGDGVGAQLQQPAR